MITKSTHEITIRLELPDKVHHNSQVSGSLVITNQGDKAIKLITPFYHAAMNLVVFDALWNQVLANSVGKVHIAQEHFEIAPDQSATFELKGLTYTSGTAHMAFSLKSGTYYIMAIYHPGTAKLPDQSFYPIAAASNIEKLIIE
jgi:hypothetical protein